MNRINDIIHKIKCLKCQNTSFINKENYIVCSHCNKKYLFEDGILKLLPEKTMRQPIIYNDKNYMNWISSMDQDYYYKKKIVSWIQNAGHKKIKQLVKNIKSDFFLDIGCGDGAHIPYCVNNNYIGVDIDNNSLLKLITRYPNKMVIQADCYDLPFKDNAFDCIVNIYNIEHLVYLDIALEELNRILSKQGNLFISVPNVGGLLWYTGSKLSSQKDLKTETMDFKRVIEISHINCIQQINKAIKRYFKIKKQYKFPVASSFLGINFYLISTYHCLKQ